MLLMVMCAGAFVVAAAAQSRDAGVGPRPAGTATLGGRVVRDGTPVVRALVSINAGDGRADRSTVTDEDGRFVFERVPAGRYLVTASKSGWVKTYFGSPRPGHPPGVRVAVEDGARLNIDIPIVPGSVIAGRIVDEAGRPMARQWPWLLESRMVGDRRMLARMRFPYDIGSFEQSTDDRGEFRLFGLPPGTYYLTVNPSIANGARLTTAAEVRWAMQPPAAAAGPAPDPGPIAGYAPLYFPGTPDPSEATAIVVGPGEVREGLEFRVGFVPMARVGGVVLRQDGSPPPGATIQLIPRDAKVSLEGGLGLRAGADRNGRFTLQNVPPGEYRMTAQSNAGAAGGGAGSPPGTDNPRTTPPDWAQADVVVNGRDVEGIGLTLAPASSITGRIVFDGTTARPPADLKTIRLQFIASDAMAMAMAGAGSAGTLQTATVDADGTFRIEGLAPNRYLATASWPGMRTGDGTAGWWLTTMHVGARELVDAPIDVPPNAEVRDVRITFRDRIGAIEGVLADAAGRPAPEYFVIAFPAERTSWTTVSRRAVPPVRPGTDGRFRLVGLLPGDYFLAVVTAVDPDDLSDAAFLDGIVPGAIRIALGAGETRRQDLRIGK
jgi:hypothetical protein